MMHKVFLATLVIISLAYLSDAVYFKDRFPGKTLADLADCKDGHSLTGIVEVKQTLKFKPKNGKQCAKYCLKQRLAGQRKDNDNKHIVGSQYLANMCFCGRFLKDENTPASLVIMNRVFSCTFKPEEKEEEKAKKSSWTEFSPVGDCSATCGQGTLTYKRICEGLEEFGDCDVMMIDEKTETCNLGECEKEEELIPGETCWVEGQKFDGKTVDTTASGRKCDAWDPVTGGDWHYFDDTGEYTYAVYDAFYRDTDPEEGSPAGSFCRNFRSDPKGPYCFVGAVEMKGTDIEEAIRRGETLTTQEHFEYCGIPKCP